MLRFVQWLCPSWAEPSLLSVSSACCDAGFCFVLAPVSVVFSVDVHSTGAGKAKEGKCQKLKPSFEDYDLCEVRFADSAPQVWLRGRQLGSSIVKFFSAVAQVAAASAAAYHDGLEPVRVFFLYYLIIVGMLMMLPLLLGVLESSVSVLAVTVDWASAAWFAFVGLLMQVIAAATSVARAAAHKFVLVSSSGVVVSCSILAKMQHGNLVAVLHGHVLGLRIFVVRFFTLVDLLNVLVGNISLAFSGLVPTTLCHEQRVSRSAFAQAKATPRVDVAETPEIEMELEKPECRFPVFVRTFSGTRTFYASSSMLISDFTLLVSQSTAVPETSFYLTFQGTLLHGGHMIGEVGIGRDASLTMRGRLLGGATKGTSFPQYHEWYCVRCQRGGCWATKFSCFRCGLSRLESEAAMGGFPQPTSKGGGKGKGVFREAQYPGRGGDGVPRNVPPTTRRVPNSGKPPAGSPVQIDQLIGLLTGLGCSAAVLKSVEEAVNAKSKPRVVPAAEHTVFVLKEKWDRAEAHRIFLQEHAERKQQEYEAASQRATDQAVLADDLKRQYWKARKELDKTAASCASASVGERESVNSDDGLANVGLDDEEMEQVYPECMLDTPEAPPAKRAKGRVSANNSSSGHPAGETVSCAATCYPDPEPSFVSR